MALYSLITFRVCRLETAQRVIIRLSYLYVSLLGIVAPLMCLAKMLKALKVG